MASFQEDAEIINNIVEEVGEEEMGACGSSAKKDPANVKLTPELSSKIDAAFNKVFFFNMRIDSYLISESSAP